MLCPNTALVYPDIQLEGGLPSQTIFKTYQEPRRVDDMCGGPEHKRYGSQ